jgi:DNA-binding MarR family transcriptional regulator
VRGNGLSASQFMALLRIADAPGISRAELARGLQVSPQAVGGLTNQLVDKGLIERTRSDPGLASAYTLTDDGYEVLDEVRPLIDGLTDDMLRFFRPNLAGAMDGALRHLLERL